MAETVENIINDELTVLQADVIKRHEQSGQVATGNTGDSFAHYTPTPTTGILEGNAYVGVLERGRRPGKVPANFKDILQRWAAAKGLSFSTPADLNRWAYFVTKKIREEGTALYRSGRTEDIFETPIAEFTDRLANRVTAFFETEIENEIFNK